MSKSAELHWTVHSPTPEGAKVQIDVITGVEQAGGAETLGEKLLRYAGRITDAPADPVIENREMAGYA